MVCGMCCAMCCAACVVCATWRRRGEGDGRSSCFDVLLWLLDFWWETTHHTAPTAVLLPSVYTVHICTSLVPLALLTDAPTLALAQRCAENKARVIAQCNHIVQTWWRSSAIARPLMVRATCPCSAKSTNRPLQRLQAEWTRKRMASARS